MDLVSQRYLVTVTGTDGKRALSAAWALDTAQKEDFNVKYLVQLDKLIRLLETSISTYLRLQQSAAFKMLRMRLKTVPIYSFSGGEQQISTGRRRRWRIEVL